MKKFALVAAIAVAMGSASLALADDGFSQYQVPTQQSTAKHGGLYVGGGAGYLSTAVPEKLFKDAGAKVDYHHLTFNAHAGYLFPVTQQFLLGVEGGYNYLPQLKVNQDTNSNDTISLKTDSSYSIDFLGVAKYYFTDKFDGFVKGGGTYEKYDLTYNENDNGTITNQKYSASGIKPKVAIGLGYEVLPHLELTAEYSHTFAADDANIDDVLNAAKDNKKSDLLPSNNAVLVGANYYFNI